MTQPHVLMRHRMQPRTILQCRTCINSSQSKISASSSMVWMFHAKPKPERLQANCKWNSKIQQLSKRERRGAPVKRIKSRKLQTSSKQRPKLSATLGAKPANDNDQQSGRCLIYDVVRTYTHSWRLMCIVNPSGVVACDDHMSYSRKVKVSTAQCKVSYT